MEVNHRSIATPHESHLLESISVPIRRTRPFQSQSSAHGSTHGVQGQSSVYLTIM